MLRWAPLLALLACAAPPHEPSPEPVEPLRKKLLLVTIDTLRWDGLSFDGNPLPTSPALDGLMGAGVAFDRALAPIARTTPSLATVLTGRYPQGHGVRVLVDSLSPQIPTLATLARDSRARTVAVVSNHVLVFKRRLHHGFDVYDHSGDARSAADTTAAAIVQLSRITRDERAFVWVHYIDPHAPYTPDPAHASAFDPDYRGPYAERFGEVAGGVGDRAYPPELGKRRAVFHNPLDAATNAHIQKLYAAEVRSTDDAIADLLAYVDENFDDDWLIVFTADHGEAQGEHGYWWDHGDYVWQPELHVPLSFTFPEDDPLRRSGRVAEWVSLADVAPTVAELMEYTWPDETGEALEGRSLVQALAGQPLEPRPVFAECGHSFFIDEVPDRRSNDVAGRFRAVIDGNDKLIWTPGAPDATAYRLFDLAADPAELRDLAAERPARVRELAARLSEWAGTANPTPRAPDAEDLELLQELGYVEEDPPSVDPE